MSAIVLTLSFVATLATSARPAQCEGHVLVAYYSETGHTRALAEAVAAGANRVAGVRVTLASVDSVAVGSLGQADAVIVGSPVHNANVAPPVQAFINRWPFDGTMRDKIGAAFASGGGISAGEEATQLAILRSMLVFGMLVVGGPDWTSAFGASAVTHEPPFTVADTGHLAPSFVAKAQGLGTRVADLTRRLVCAAAVP